MTGGSVSDSVLQELKASTTDAVTKIQDRTVQGVDDALDQLSQLEHQIEEAHKIKDEKQRNIRLQVLETNLEELRKIAATEEHDLAQAVLGLNGVLEALGLEYEQLAQPSDEDRAPVRQAEAILAEAQEQLAEAGKKWFAWRRAKATILAEQNIAAAKQRIEEAKNESRRRARQRLMRANMEQSLQEFTLRVKKTIDIMKDRLKQVASQVQAVTARKGEAFRVKELAATKLEELDKTLNDAEAELRSEEEKLNGLVNGSPEHAAQTKKVSDLRAKVEAIRGSRNTALAVFQSKEKFAAELEIHERTQMKLRDNMRMWIAALESDTEERVITFRSRLEAMKAMADQEAAKNLDDLGAEIDGRNAEYMATAGAVSDRVRMDKVEKHPERFRRAMDAQAAQAEAVQKIREREAVAIESFRRQYGIDPMRSSLFFYETKKAEEESAPAGEPQGATSGLF